MTHQRSPRKEDRELAVLSDTPPKGSPAPWVEESLCSPVPCAPEPFSILKELLFNQVSEISNRRAIQGRQP